MAIAATKVSVEQSRKILEQLALLHTDQHKNSKMVFYPTQIWLESNSSTWRTAAEWVTYAAGYETSRDLESLCPLIQKVHSCMTDSSRALGDCSSVITEKNFVVAAKEGLEALKLNQYSTDEKKRGMIDAAVATLELVVQFFQSKINEQVGTMSANFQAKKMDELAAKDREIATLKAELLKTKEEIVILKLSSVSQNVPIEPISAAQLAETIKISADLLMAIAKQP